MAVKHDLKIYSTDGNNNKVTASVSYVNPNATNGQLLTLSKSLIALTNNTFKSAERVTTEDITATGD